VPRENTREPLMSSRPATEIVLIVYLAPDRLLRWAAPWALLTLVMAAACVDLTPPARPSTDTNVPVADARDARVDQPDLAGGETGDVDGQPDTDEPDAGEDGASADVTTDAGLATGQGCASDGECRSGACVDQVCCSTACTSTCMACNVPGSEGACTPVAAGEDPADECAMAPASTCGLDGTCNGAGACQKYKPGTECQPGSCAGSVETPASTCDATGICQAASPRSCSSGAVCMGTSCATSCTVDSACQTGFFCETGVCRAKRGAGATCSAAGQCNTGHCVDGVCCGTPCTELCSVCNLPSAMGTCTPVPAGQDPRNVCAVDTANVCGNDGTCNGAGVCRRPTATPCGVTSCTAGVESPRGTCNGAGTCAAQPTKDCGAYQCAAAACATSCTSDAGCTAGFTCAANACAALPGPVLHWKLDEANGITAFDASPNGFNGTYEGNGTATPATSPLLPPLLFPNAASRAFTRSLRHAIQLANMPALLKPTNDVSMSIWYRSSTPGAANSEELVSAGDSYTLRAWAALNKLPGNPPAMEVSKHTSAGHFQCFLAAPKALDGNWHHVAGVITATAMVVYVDGVASTPCALVGPIEYLGPDFWVGRHGGTSGNSNYDFEGNIDEVRVYTRALAAGEVARLAAGRP
jgi:hypothetical protein